MKEFNTTGVCIPDKHYMVDISNKLAEIKEMVDRGRYFTINRPRQYGKTTTLYLLTEELLKDDYLVLKMSFEAKSSKIFSAEEEFVKSFMKEIKRNIKLRARVNKENLLNLFNNLRDSINNLEELGEFIGELVRQARKKVALIIDEVDKSSNNQLFLDFLGILRSKYLLREQGEDNTFHSVILAGVYDVKNLKIKIRPEEEKKYNSPWNIAVDFEVEMDFNVEEITTMLKDYRDDKNIDMDIIGIAERIYYYTSGQPFLVSKLAQIIDEKLLPEKDKQKWQLTDVERAVKILLKQTNTNFESLIKNLENDPELYRLVSDIILEGKSINYNLHNPLIEKGEMLGIFAEIEDTLRIHNRIYEQIIYNYMVSRIETDVDTGMYNFRDSFISATEQLDMEKVLLKFQQFIKEEYSDKDIEFLERNGRLLFLAFIKPIINNKGFDFKEVQISQERRLDVVITYLEQKYIVELKIWRGEKYHQDGVKQLADYLDKQNLDKGYLISFDFNKNKEFRQEEINFKDKEVFAVWV